MRPRCWAWDTILRVLAEGPAPKDLLTREVYGDDSHVSRQAMGQMLLGLTRTGPQYRGGPWIRKVKYGWYGLLDAPVAESLPDLIVRRLKELPRTRDDLARLSGRAPRTISWYLGRLRKQGVPIESATAPPWRWANKGKGAWTPWYWIGRTPMCRVRYRAAAR